MTVYLLPIQYVWFWLCSQYRYWFVPPTLPTYFCPSCLKEWEYLDEGSTPDKMCSCKSDGLPSAFILLPSRPDRFICTRCDMNGHAPLPGSRDLSRESIAAHMALHRERRDEMREKDTSPTEAETVEEIDTSLAHPSDGRRTCRNCKRIVYVGSNLPEHLYRIHEGRYEHIDCENTNKL